ncbi:bifunctional metallophosphatase/5'-nucleotidase [Pseudaquabacterium pictum]|uniref:5'-nucleotidase n=1 Tax=Pseudaquabacterium pictum TaxID=2315236 RepID=A0A480ASR5_9BURK|nr:bifunctional metallophosphatase/5'-nucleotidase [Rubrivivax pictus]GCL64719.1 5'-nucleotidase [Rubrivivax pictus]
MSVTPPAHPRRPRAATLALLALLAACGTPQPPTAPAASAAAVTPVQLRVIAFNDFHGHLEPGSLAVPLPDPVQPGGVQRVAAGGAAALAGLVQALRQGAPHSVLASTGDMVGAAPLVSALFRHESTVEVLNQLGVDVAAAGNHEFDAGTTELLRLLRGGCAANAADAATSSCALQPAYAGARFPVLAANVLAASGQPLLPPTWVLRVGGVQVGFIGAVTRDTPSIVVPSGVAGLRFEDEAEAINRAAEALDAQGVKALVALVHEGGETGAAGAPADWNDPACPGWRGDMARMAQRISPKVDVIFSAHTHQGYNCLLDGRPVMQALSFGRAVSVADLVIDPASGEIDRTATRSRNLPVLNDRTDAAQRQRLLASEPAPWGQALAQARPVAAVQQTVAAYAQAAAPRVQRPVGRIAGSFDRRGRTDSAAGRLVADAQLAATRAPDQGGAQLALMNPGGVRSDLVCAGTPPCTVTYGDAFGMQPFGNSLVVMTLTGVELKAVLEQQQPAGRTSPSFLSPSAGLAYRWVASAPPGQRVQDLTLNGQPVGPKQALRVTVNSFMADGGDGYAPLRAGRQRLGGPQDLDALIAHLQTQPAPVATARITWVD